MQQSIWFKSVDSMNYFSNLSVNKPTVPLSEEDSRTKYFLNYVLDLSNVNKINVGKALNLIGVKYLIIRNDDYNYSYQDTISALEKQQSLNLVFQKDFLYVFENKEYSGLIDIKTSKISTNLGLETLKYLDAFNINTATTKIDFVDKDVTSDILPVSYLLEQGDLNDFVLPFFKNSFIYPSNFSYTNNPSGNWANLSLQGKTHAESTFYFNINNYRPFEVKG